MSKIIECVPNFSEGQDEHVVKEIVSVIEGVSGVKLLDYSLDSDHHRSVITFAGCPDAVIEAAFLATQKASELIDLTKHQGQHPRMGATDVIPLIPLRGVTMDECVEYSKQLGKRIGDELKIPVFLYEKSASAPHRSNLANIRKGGFESMTEKLKDTLWQPDYGESVVHPCAGVVAVGARGPLIAFNVNLDTMDVSVAKRIAKMIRESSGGFTFCKALGLEITNRQMTQVSMNLTDYTQTSIHQVFDVIERETQRVGVSIIGSEIIGLVPMDALMKSAAHYLKLNDFTVEQVLELSLFEN